MPTQKQKTKSKTATKPKARAATKTKTKRAGAQKATVGTAKRKEIQDFVARYDEGRPADGISDEETLRHHEDVAAGLSADEYREVATQSFERMEPSERSDLGRRLRQQAAEEGLDTQEASDDSKLEDSGVLGSLAGMLQDRKPGALGQLLSGQNGGVGQLLNSPAARAALGGIAAMAAKRLLK